MVTEIFVQEDLPWGHGKIVGARKFLEIEEEGAVEVVAGYVVAVSVQRSPEGVGQAAGGPPGTGSVRTSWSRQP